jgi:hypothetical protein
MSNSIQVTSGDLGGVAGVFRALAEARWTSFDKLYRHATLRWPDLKQTVNLALLTHSVHTASRVSLTLSAPRPDGTEAMWVLDVWIGPEVVAATGQVYATGTQGVVVDHLFERQRAHEPHGACQRPSGAHLPARHLRAGRHDRTCAV